MTTATKSSPAAKSHAAPKDAIALLKATDDTMTLARAYLLAAGAELRRREESAAEHNLEAAAKLLGAHPDPGDLGMLRTGESLLATLQGDGDADDQTDPYTRVRLYWSLARLNVLDGRSADALLNNAPAAAGNGHRIGRRLEVAVKIVDGQNLDGNG
jgi:hypothetical protein